MAGVNTDDVRFLRGRKRLEDKLAPQNMGLAMIRAGAILTGYELVKSSIIDQPKSFFSFNLDPATGKPIPSAEYEREVLGRGKGAWAASCAWLIYMGALTAKQVESLEAIRAHRGEVAHELARLLVDPDAEVDLDMLAQLRDIMHSLDRFWGSIEIDINPDFDGNRDEIDLDGIRSGSGVVLDYLCNLSGLE